MPGDKELRTILADTCSRLFTAQVTPQLQESAEKGTWPEALWRQVEENGLTLPQVPESRGGAGGSWSDAHVVLTTAGRHPESDIFLDDVTVSRRHAEFYRQGGRFTVRDVGSLNGTYVNRERIEEADLSGGDEVQIGKFRLVFLLGPRSQAEYGGGGSQVGG